MTNTGKGAFVKKFSAISDDPRVEVLARSDITHKDIRRSFRVSSIDYLDDLEEGRSAIVLRSGLAVPLSIPYDALVEKIDSGATLIDLKPFGFQAPKPGERAADGSVYLGLFSGRDWFVEDCGPNGSKTLRMDFQTADRHARVLSTHGRHDWMLPPGGSTEPDIIREMFNARSLGAFRGTYNSTYYRSSARSGNEALELHFGSGNCKFYSGDDSTVCVRCVRSEPHRT